MPESVADRENLAQVMPLDLSKAHQGFYGEREEKLILFYHECDGCGCPEERVFTDSWTGKEFCFMCLSKIIDQITMSPTEDGGDNLPELIAAL